MELNEYILKLHGSAPIEKPLELGKRYAVGMEIGIVDENKTDNENGSYDHEFKGRLIRAEIHTDLGHILKTRDKTRESAKTRYAILVSKSNYPDYEKMEEESYYKMVQGGIRHFLPEIIEMIRKSAK